MMDDEEKITGGKLATEFTQESSLHGIKYVGSRNIFILRRFIWITIFLGCIAFFCYAALPRIYVFMKSPTNTKLVLEYKRPLDFPAVTICNNNLLREDYFVKTNKPVLKEFFKADFIRNYMDYTIPITLDDIVNETLKNHTYDEIMRDGSTQQGQMFFWCIWGVSRFKCSEKITQSLTDMGYCWTFNSAKYAQEHGVVQSFSSGSNEGLTILMDISPEQYLYTRGHSSGARVLVHHQDEFPLVNEYGLAVSPGEESYISMRQEKLQLLPAPYEGGTCVDIEESSFINPLKYFSEYDYAACKMECFKKIALEKCSCAYLMPENVSHAYNMCSIYEYQFCVRPAEYEEKTSHQNSTDDCICRTPCKTINYKVTISGCSVPAKNVMDFFGNIPGFTEDMFRKRFVSIKVFYKALNYDNIFQESAYTWQQLFADVGGQLGLCLGASILSCYEFIEFLNILSAHYMRKLLKAQNKIGTLKPEKVKITKVQKF